MGIFKTIYKCCKCGATSYQRMIDRAADGALQTTGQYRCTGCRNVFASLRAWWEPHRAVELQSSGVPSRFPAD